MPSLQSVGTSCFCHTVLNRFARRGAIDNLTLSASATLAGCGMNRPLCRSSASWLLVLRLRLLLGPGLCQGLICLRNYLQSRVISLVLDSLAQSHRRIAAFVDHVLLHVFRTSQIVKELSGSNTNRTPIKNKAIIGLNFSIFRINQLNFKIKFSHPPPAKKSTTLRRTTSYDVLSLKIGPTSASID